MNHTFKLLPLDQTLSSGRFYPRKVVEECLKECHEDLKARRLMGEIGIITDAKIHLDNVTHLVTDLRIEDNVLVADVEILDSPKGKYLKEYLEKKGRVTAHPRWVADMQEYDGKWMVDNLRLVSVDLEAVDAVPDSIPKEDHLD